MDLVGLSNLHVGAITPVVVFGKVVVTVSTVVEFAMVSLPFCAGQTTMNIDIGGSGTGFIVFTNGIVFGVKMPVDIDRTSIDRGFVEKV
jgi:hypothetical protein